jgi:glycine cleavage system H lipoate-binding protein
MQKRGSQRLRYGLDAFAVSLLAPLQGTIYPDGGTRIPRGGILCWLRTGSRTIPLHVPVSGRLAQSNPRVRQDTSCVSASPYQDGWLAEITEYSRSDLQLLDVASQACRSATSDNLILKKEVDTLLHQGRHLGATLPDGGLPVAGLREILGEPVYFRMVKRFLH